MAFAPPEAKDLMGPLCLSCVLFSFRFIRFSVMLCSALRHRDDGPAACISWAPVGGLPSAFTVEAAGGRGRRKGEARMLVSSLPWAASVSSLRLLLL